MRAVIAAVQNKKQADNILTEYSNRIDLKVLFCDVRQNKLTIVYDFVQIDEVVPTDLINDAHDHYLEKKYQAVSQAYEDAVKSSFNCNTCWDDYAADVKLPKTLSKTKAVDYIIENFKTNPFKTKKALKEAIQLAAADGVLDYKGKKTFQVNYHGYGNSYNYAATSGTRPISYDNFSRESIDNWIASVIVSK